MCTEVAVMKDGATVYCNTVGELAAALGVEPSAVSGDPEDYCLCNFHHEALGARFATEPEGWPNTVFVIQASQAFNP